MADKDFIAVKALGLNTQPNEMGVPEGSLAVAENVEVTRDNVVQMSQGFEDFSSNLPDFVPQQLLSFAGTNYVNIDSGLWYYDTSQNQWFRKTAIAGGTIEYRSLLLIGSSLYLAEVDCISVFDLTTGRKTYLAGRSGIPGTTDATGSAARFTAIFGMAYDGSTKLYVSDNQTIRTIVISTGVVSTIAGTAATTGTTDNTGSLARFNNPCGVVWSSSASALFVADQNNHSIRKVTAAGVVTTHAGLNGTSGSANGSGSTARFNQPLAITLLGSNLYVCDYTNSKLRVVPLSGSTSDLVSSVGYFGITNDGTKLYVLQSGSGAIYSVTTGGTATLVAGGVSSPAAPVDGIGSAARLSFNGFNGGNTIFAASDRLYFLDIVGFSFNSVAIRLLYFSTSYVYTLETLTDSSFKNTNLLDGVVIGPEGRRIRGASSNGNVYVTSSFGIRKSTSASASLSLAGMPRCLDLALSLSSAGTPVLLTDTGASPTAGADQARAYRGVICLRDANNNLVQGAPSSRVYIVNTAGATRDVSIVVQLPPEVTTSHFIQIYASAIIDNGTVVDPGDELRLVKEYFPTATDLSTGTCTILDITPDAFRGADLYTNAEQLGIARQFDRPPLCRDMAWFNNKLVVSNTTDPHRMDLQLLGTVGIVTPTITLAGVVYTAGTAESTSTGTFQIFKPGGGGYTDKGTQALNVDFTARSLCNVINKYAVNTSVYAYYVSSGTDVPGKIQIEERGVGGSAFTIICSSSLIGNNFSPAIPTSGTSYSSVADRRVNYLRVSEEGQPEHMSRARNIIVGGADEEIQRIIALRGSLIIIKDRSVWRLTQAEPGEAPVLLDNTCGIQGRDTAATLNNAVYFLSDQGFVCATENGIQIVGRPIEDRVLAGVKTKSADYANTNFVGQGVERERFYICTAYDAAAGEISCYRYSPISNGGRGAWTKRRINAYGFCVTSGRLHYALNSAYGHVLRQRASRLDGVPWYRDYAEEQVTALVSSVDTTAKTVTCSLTNYVNYGSYNSYIPGYGWKCYNGSSAAGATQRLVLSGAANGAEPNVILTLDSVSGINASDSITLFRPIPWKVEYSPITGGNPLSLSSFNEVLVKAETCMAYGVDVSFANQVDTKTDPTSDNWIAQPSASRVYVPTATGAEPSLTSNDFASTSSATVNPQNEIRTLVDPTRAQGEHLSVRLAGSIAEGFVAIKALFVSITGSGSARTRQ